MSISKFFSGRIFSYLLLAILTTSLTYNIESLALSTAIAFCIGALYAMSCALGAYLIDCYYSRKSSSR
jgi:tetrahydromethanopterin S-methyltransferase subunit E